MNPMMLTPRQVQVLKLQATRLDRQGKGGFYPETVIRLIATIEVLETRLRETVR